MENITKLIIIISIITIIISYALIQSETKFFINIGNKTTTQETICQETSNKIGNQTIYITRCNNGTTKIAQKPKINVTIK